MDHNAVTVLRVDQISFSDWYFVFFQFLAACCMSKHRCPEQLFDRTLALASLQTKPVQYNTRVVSFLPCI